MKKPIRTCMNCFCGPAAHNNDGCTTPKCRCDRDPYQAVQSKPKVKSCQDCLMLVRMEGIGQPVILIDKDTGKKSLGDGNGSYWACNYGYWGGIVERLPSGLTGTRRASGFLQSQAGICADFTSGGSLCTNCEEEPGKYLRNSKADYLCWPCVRIFDRENRVVRLERNADTQPNRSVDAT